jgi:adenylosuccinate lyase
MRANLNMGGGLVYSQGVLLALVERGMPREDAYRIVQAAAAAAWDEGKDFKGELQAQADAARLLSAADLEALFDPGRYLRNLDVVFDRLAKLTVGGEP